MPVFAAKHMLVQLDGATGAYKTRLGAGDGTLAWPDLAANGKESISLFNAGSFFGRLETKDLEGDVTVSLFHVREAIDSSEFFDAALHRGKWATAPTCDPGGDVWAPSLYIQGLADGKLFALRWPSARIMVSGATAVEGGTLAFKASVVGEPLYGAAAQSWPN